MLRLTCCLAVLAAMAVPALAGGGAKDLLPKSDFKGWTRMPIPGTAKLQEPTQWHVDRKARLIICDGDKGHDWMRLDREFADFDLHVEWRFTPVAGENPRYNSGLFVRTAADSSQWVQAQMGPPSNGGFFFWVELDNGKPRRTMLKDKMPADNPVRPAGEWNTYDISARGPLLVLKTNGVETSRIEHAPLERGHIGLEGEGYRIEFRNLRITEVKSK
jgi:hypothetical protein